MTVMEDLAGAMLITFMFIVLMALWHYMRHATYSVWPSMW